MIKKVLWLILFIPCVALGEVNESTIMGDWEWLGNSFERTSDYSSLLRTGPSVMRFLEQGRYEYISVSNGKNKEPVIGSWKYKSGVLIITRPDNGTFNNKVISYESGVLETQDTYMESYMYMRKKIANN